MANLHLIVDGNIKEKAKQIAKKRGENLSTLVEAYLFSLVREDKEIKIAPELLKLPKLKPPKDYKKAKEEYLDKKYGKL